MSELVQLLIEISDTNVYIYICVHTSIYVCTFSVVHTVGGV